MIERLRFRQRCADQIYVHPYGSIAVFVASKEFLEAHGDNCTAVSVIGQDCNPTTLRLAHMNLAIHRIEANLRPQPADTFLRPQHPNRKADFVLANPPFNVSGYSGPPHRFVSRLSDRP